MSSNHRTKDSLENKLVREVIHDLVNPLTSLSLMLESGIGNKFDYESSRTKINSILKILSTLLRENIKQREFCIKDSLGEILSCLDSKIKRHNIIFTFLIPTELRVTAPQLLFYKIFLNIISNSIDSYENIKCRVADSSEIRNEIIINSYNLNGDVVIDIEDFGCGFPKKSKNASGSNFKCTKRDSSGLGIGIISQSCKLCNAKLKFICKKSNGTITRITFKSH